MGVISHHFIVVAASYGNFAEEAHRKAVQIFGDPSDGLVSPLSSSVTNGSQSFCIFPDGSKEGWGASDDGDARRDEFIGWLNRQRYSDGSTPYKWAEVEVGECGTEDANDCGASVRRHYFEVEPGDDYKGPADLEEGAVTTSAKDR